MFNQQQARIALVASTCLFMLLAGCGAPAGTPGTITPTLSPAQALMPVLSGYTVTDGRSLQGYITGLADGAALLSANPQMIPVITAVDQLAQCYQEKGALSMRIYSEQAKPLNSGAVVIVDRNMVTDLNTLASCTLSQMETSGPTPCSYSYSLPRDDNEFFIAYMATQENICQAFCDQLEGCTGH